MSKQLAIDELPPSSSHAQLNGKVGPLGAETICNARRGQPEKKILMSMDRDGSGWDAERAYNLAIVAIRETLASARQFLDLLNRLDNSHLPHTV